MLQNAARIDRCVTAVAQLERPLLAAQAQPVMTTLAGFAARYPAYGAKSGTERFWECLSLGADMPTVVPLTRWDIDDVYSPDPASRKMCASCALPCAVFSDLVKRLSRICARPGMCALAALWKALTSLTRRPSCWHLGRPWPWIPRPASCCSRHRSVGTSFTLVSFSAMLRNTYSELANGLLLGKVKL